MASTTPEGFPAAARTSERDTLRRLVQATSPVSLSADHTLAVLGELEALLPTAGLPRGSVVEVAGSAGVTSLAMSLAAGPTRAGSWMAVAGFPQLGWEAAREAGVRLERTLAIGPPASGGGGRASVPWAEVLAALVDAVDIVVCGPAAVPAAAVLRRLRARVRERDAVLLLVDGARSAGAVPGTRRRSTRAEVDLRLEITRASCSGLASGWGHLAERHLEVVVQGRGAASRLRRYEVTFGAAGRVCGVAEVAGAVRGVRSPSGVDPLEAAG